MLGPAAAAAPQAVSMQASASTAVAPLRVVLTGLGDAASFHWDFSDGSSADGTTVEHDFAAGRITVTLTATSASGETAAAQTTITAYGVAVDTARNAVRAYGARSTLRGRVVPAEQGVVVPLAGPGGGVVGRATTNASGAYVIRGRIRSPGQYSVRSDRGAVAALGIVVAPKLNARLLGSGARGSRYEVSARVTPAAAGKLSVTVDRGSRRIVDRTGGAALRVRLDTRRLWTYRVAVRVEPNEG